MAVLTGTGVDPAEPRLRLLVLQPTPFCNIDCSYCYLSDRKSTATMSLETVNLICRRVFESPRLDRQLEVAWHGGEPLVVPLAWYEDALELMAKQRPAVLQLKHCFQTNGLLVNEDWARFFARTGAKSASASMARQSSTIPAGEHATGVEHTSGRCARSARCKIRASGFT